METPAMSLLDNLIGALGGGSAQQGANPLLQVAIQMLAGGSQGAGGAGGGLGGLGALLGSLGGSLGGSPGGGGAGGAPGGGGLDALLGSLAGGGAGGAGGAGGLGALIEAFQRNGMGAQMDSWIGTGQNAKISGDQLEQALGGDLLGGIAQQLGMSRGEASSGLADVLPQLIDRLTPQGQVPEGGFGDVASIMEALAPRR
jgi:uncharacterized protein YidB (DUF937 family)